jgi:hypothetical protein
MNRQQIEARLRKTCGKHAYYEVCNDAPDAEERERLRAEYQDAILRGKAAQARMVERTTQLQSGDDEYQSALAEWKGSCDAQRKAQKYLRYRISAGHIVGLGGLRSFHVSAQGDTWPEVFAKLEASR